MSSNRMKFAAIFTLTLTAILLVVLVLLAWGDGDPAPEDPAIMPTPFGEYSPGSVAEVPLSSGHAMFEALGLQTLSDYETYSVDLMKELGVSWVRLDFLFDGWHFNEPASLELFRQAGIEVIGTARPINDTAPADLSRFQDELGKIVARYPWVGSWQIGNEPNIHWDEDDYARLFLAGEKVVREKCPECTVILGGVAARYPSHEGAVAFYSRTLDAIDAGYDGAGEAFDAFDMHYYGFYGADAILPGLIDSYRQMLAQHGYTDTDFLVTETSTYSGSPTTVPASMAQTEEQQATELVRRFVVMLGAGASHVAWARPYENFNYHGVVDGYYDHNALVYNGFGEEARAGIPAGTRKLAFNAYQTLIGKLSDFDTVERLAPGQYRFDFNDGRRSVYVAWASGDNTALRGPSGAVLLTDIDGSTAPADAADIVLTARPVFVEAAAASG